MCKSVNLMIIIFSCIAFPLIILSPGNAASESTLDFTHAIIVTPANLTTTENKAITMLIDEVEKRTRLRLPQVNSWPEKAESLIVVGTVSSLKNYANKIPSLNLKESSEARERFQIHLDRSASTPVVTIAGSDARGVLFGVGYLLRKIHLNRDKITIDGNINVITSPKYPLRGHQLGYRPKTNSYDGWTLAMWEQYIRDLAVFGTNAVELIPPRSDDDADSPHFPLPPMEMMIEMSRILNEYDLDVWIWYPALDDDYSDPKTVEFALNEWAEVFKKLPRINAILVPCGDPGKTPPEYLLPMLEKQTQSLHRFHPQAQMWVAPQGFNQERLDKFLAIIQTEPAWLSGIVYGPQTRIPLSELRSRIPAKYPIRHYPDITHSLHCQYPVPDWDRAFAVTEGREVINPRPTGYARIFQLLQKYTIGFITYSEGCNDDVNKIVWSALGWNPEMPVTDILRDYSRYFIGDTYSDDFAQGLLALEKNWQGPVLINENINTTLLQFQAMERNAGPQLRLNWRFQMALYRAYYDAYIRSRLQYETGLEEQGMAILREAYDAYVRSRLLYETRLEERGIAILREARNRGSSIALSQVETILNQSLTNRVAPDLRSCVFELAEALFQSIHMQLSVERYLAISIDRGANLDTIDYPLNNRLWLKQEFEKIRQIAGETNRQKKIEELVNWTNPGPGGFYDDLGNLARQPHLLRGKGFNEDPAFYASSLVNFSIDSSVPIFSQSAYIPTSWWDDAMTLFDAPLELQYEKLNPNDLYKVRVVYSGKEIRLVADGRFEIHSYLKKKYQLLEFDIPAEATADGELKLTWNRPPGGGGNGRGNQVAEVWLMKR